MFRKTLIALALVAASVGIVAADPAADEAKLREAERVAAEAERKAQEAANNFPEAPKEAVNGFIAAVKGVDFCQAVAALPADKLQVEAAKWAEELGVEISVQMVNLLQWASGSEIRGKDARYLLDSRQDPDNEARMMVALYVRKKDKDNETEAHYRVAPKLLAELNVQVPYSIKIQHRSSRKLKNFAVTNASLTEIVANLAGECGADYVLRSDLSDGTKLTLRLKDKTIAECLHAAANAAGWDISYPAFDLDVDMGEASEDYANREFINVMGNRDKPIVTPLDAVYQLIQRQLNSQVRDNVVSLKARPNNPLPQNK